VLFRSTRRSLASDTPYAAGVAWAFSVVLLACWTGWFLLGSVTVHEVSRRARLEVSQASHHVASLIPGIVVTNSLIIGRDVAAGDALLELDARTERLRLAEEEARLAAIPPRIASLREEIAARSEGKEKDLQAAGAAAEAAKFRHQEAGVALDFARDAERRYSKLSNMGGVSVVEANRLAAEAQKLGASRGATLSEVRRAELEAQGRALQNEAQIEVLRRSIVTLEGDAATTRAAIARLRIEIEKHIVRAPIAGQIGDVTPLPAGAYVAEGQRLATVVPKGSVMIVADFAPSPTLGRVRQGQKARMRLDAFPWAQYGALSATVTHVATEIRDNLVRVEFALAPESRNSPVAQHGLPGAIEVDVEQVSPAVLALRGAGLLLSGAHRDAAGGDAPR
jgi:membrane fusion protein (multidrug efflux system)